MLIDNGHRQQSCLIMGARQISAVFDSHLHTGVLRHIWRSAVLLLTLLTTINDAAGFVCAVEIDPNTEIRKVLAISNSDTSGQRLILSLNGVYRLENDRLTKIDADHPVVKEYDHSWAGVIPNLDSQEEVLIATEKGLFSVLGNQLVPVRDAPIIGTIEIITGADNDGVRLLAGSGGVYRLENGRFTPLPPNMDLGFFSLISESNSKGDRLIAHYGAFSRLSRDRLVSIDTQVDVGWVNVINTPTVTGGWLVGANAGLFQVSNDKLARVDPKVGTGEVRVISEPDSKGHQLIVAENGLFELRGTHLVPVDLPEYFPRIQAVAASDTNGQWLLGTSGMISDWKGLYGFRNGQILDNHGAATGGVSVITPGDSTGRPLIGSSAGLFTLIPLQSGRLEAPVPGPSGWVVRANEPVSMKWTWSHSCARALNDATVQLEIDGTPFPSAVISILPGTSRDERVIDVSNIVVHGQGQHSIVLVADPGPEELRSLVEFRIEPNALQTAWLNAVALAPWLLISHTALFIMLIVGARWSGWCWRVVTDPLLGRFGVWFYLALRHLGPVQRWCLQRWFVNRRELIQHRPYLPVPLNGPDGQENASLDWLANLPTRPKNTWIQGNVGMGKTSLVRQLEAEFFRNPQWTNIEAAFGDVGVIPIVIPLRNVRAVVPDRTRPDQWVSELVGMVLASQGFPVNEPALLRGILANGGFLIVLDGVNEVGHEAELELFAQRAKMTRILVTSQARPQHAPDAFQIWHLPTTIEASIEPLLKLYLGDERGGEVFAHVLNTPLAHAIQSGYDLRLLADLVDRGLAPSSLPEGRAALYDAMISTLRSADGVTPYPLERLCKVTWAMWCEGQRAFTSDAMLHSDFPSDDIKVSSELLAPLRDPAQSIVRALDGERFEFRHDQMRAYLVPEPKVTFLSDNNML